MQQPRKPNLAEKDLIEDTFLRARLARPYYAVALAAMDPWVVEGLGTVAVDASWRLYFDPKWLEALPIEARVGVIVGHEIEHLLRRHSERAKVLDARGIAWNLAADAEINDDCDLQLPPDPVLPKELGCQDGLLAEDYYAAAQQKINPSLCNCGSGADSVPREWELEPTGGLKPLDVDRVIKATAEAVKEAAKTPGTVPGGIEVWADAILKPVKPSWEQQLARWRGKQTALVGARGDWSFRKLSRRWRQGEALKPGFKREQARIALIVDTSGSMNGLGSWAISIVETILRLHPQVKVWDTDAAAQRWKRGQQHRGGGGTDLGVGMREAAKESDGIVVVTDAETPWPTKGEIGVPVVVVTPEGAPETPEWVERVEIVA